MEKETGTGLPERRLNEVEQQFHDFLRSLYDKGLSNDDVALALGLGERAVQAINIRLGVRKHSYAAADLDEVLERQFGMPLEQLFRMLLIDKHMTQLKAIDYLGVGKGWFADRAQRYGLLKHLRRRHE